MPELPSCRFCDCLVGPGKDGACLRCNRMVRGLRSLGYNSSAIAKLLISECGSQTRQEVITALVDSGLRKR